MEEVSARMYWIVWPSNLLYLPYSLASFVMFQSSRELLRIIPAKALEIVWKDSKNMADGSEPPFKDGALRVI